MKKSKRKKRRNREEEGMVKLPPAEGTKQWLRSEAGIVDAMARKMLNELDWSDGWEMRNSKASMYAKCEKAREKYIKFLTEDPVCKDRISDEDIQKKLERFDLRAERRIAAIDLAVKMHCKKVMESRATY